MHTCPCRPPAHLRDLVDTLTTLAAVTSLSDTTSAPAPKARLAIMPLPLLAAAFPGTLRVVRAPPPGSALEGGGARPDPSLDDPLFYRAEAVLEGGSRGFLAADEAASALSTPRTTARPALPAPASRAIPGALSVLGKQQRGAGAGQSGGLEPQAATALARALALLRLGPQSSLSSPANSSSSSSRSDSPPQPRAPPRFYRCLADAVSAAVDGDAVVVLPGTHYCGEAAGAPAPGVAAAPGGAVVVAKRLLIMGAQATGGPVSADC